MVIRGPGRGGFIDDDVDVLALIALMLLFCGI